MNDKNYNDPQITAELIEAYYQKGWTDGFPVVPPNEQSISNMRSGAGLNRDSIIATVATRNTQIFAEKVAINAVMAGCPPEYMPVIVGLGKHYRTAERNRSLCGRTHTHISG